MLGLAAGDVAFAELLLQMHTGALADILGARLVPRDVGHVTLAGEEDLDGLAVDDQAAVLGLNGAGILAVGGVVLEHIDHVVQVHEGIVDGDDLDALLLHRGAHYQTANPAKPIDANFRNRHSEMLLSSIGNDFTGGCATGRDCAFPLAETNYTTLPNLSQLSIQITFSAENCGISIIARPRREPEVRRKRMSG